MEKPGEGRRVGPAGQPALSGPYAGSRLDEIRFWSNVTPTGFCWEWSGTLDRDGYGLYSNRRAHRLAWELLIGPCPLGLVPDHLCRNRACVNPDHLEWVTNRVNVLRGQGSAALRARKTHCPQGHEYTPESTYVRKGGQRSCYICILDRGRKRAQAKQHG